MTNRAALAVAAFFMYSGAGFAQESGLSGTASFLFDGAPVTIRQSPETAAQYAAKFATIVPECNPNCIDPAQVAEGIETVIAPAVLSFLVETVGRNEGLLVDARMPQDRAMGYIPGSVSLPFATLAQDNAFRDDILVALGARIFEDVYNFSDAQNLMIYDTGPVRNEAGTLIAALLAVGYPADRIKYYRGGMQMWSALALTIEE